MIPISPICNVCEYSQCGDKCPPTAEQAARGLNPLGAVPSQLWNSLWHDANAAVNCIKFASDTLMDEINSVLTEAGISPDALCTNQLTEAITCLLQTIDPTGGKSSVKSSATPGMVSIDNNGYMTANCVGNANNLTTTNRVIVDAINEINSTYGNAYDTMWQNAYDTEGAKADTVHASSDTDYGVGTASAYGHLKISDVCNAVLPDCGNVAASQKALADIWAYVNSTTGLGNTLACPLGTGAPGICTTAARGDHVHPYPDYASCAYCLIPISLSDPRICVYTCPCVRGYGYLRIGTAYYWSSILNNLMLSDPWTSFRGCTWQPRDTHCAVDHGAFSADYVWWNRAPFLCATQTFICPKPGCGFRDIVFKGKVSLCVMEGRVFHTQCGCFTCWCTIASTPIFNSAPAMYKTNGNPIVSNICVCWRDTNIQEECPSYVHYAAYGQYYGVLC